VGGAAERRYATTPVGVARIPALKRRAKLIRRYASFANIILRVRCRCRAAQRSVATRLRRLGWRGSRR